MPGRGDRAARWVREELAFCVVLAALLVSIAYLLLDSGRWGRTSGGIAVALLLAAVLRAIVPSSKVGMLAIRSRTVDTVVYAALGAVIMIVDVRLHST